MAIPVNFDPSQKLYLVRISMGSQFKGKSRDIDDYTREIKYVHSKEIRREIGAIRQVINSRRAAGCMPFFGAYFTNEIGKQQLIDACKIADREMKEIDPELHATPLFIKIDMPDLAAGSQFDALLSAIRTQVHEVVLNRVKAVIERNEGKALTPKTKTALLSMLEKTRALNIVNDPNVNADIDKMKARIDANQLNELKDEILVILDESKDRAQALELVDPIVVHADDEEDDQISRAAKSLPNTGRVLDLL
jgi:hypothetical protein